MATIHVTGILGGIHYNYEEGDAFDNIVRELTPSDIIVVVRGGLYEKGPRRVGVIMPVNNDALARVYRKLREQNQDLVEFAPEAVIDL